MQREWTEQRTNERVATALPARRVLLALDSAEASTAALRRAYEITRASAARLCVLSVIPSYSDEFGERVRQRLLQRRTAELGSWVRRLEPRLEREGAISIESLVGPPGQSIVAFAARLGADLIVLGTSPRARRWWLRQRAVSSYVVRKAGCSVLVVRDESQPSPLRTLPMT